MKKNKTRSRRSSRIDLVSLNGLACGSSDKDSSYVDKVKVEDTNDIKAIPDGAEKELEWLSYFDINPTKAVPEKRSDLTLFENKGGSIKYSQTTSLEVYEKLASRLMSNDPPDMFWYEASMTFPANCVKEMFQPIDSLVNFDDPLWSGVKNMADQYTLNGKHYVAPVNFGACSVITYNKDMVEAAGLEDPYELYMKGEWDWNTWYDIMDEYCQGASEDEERWGINGWFAPFIFHSTGETLIKYDADKDEYVSNLDNPAFERASGVLYNLKKNNLYNSEWIGQASDAFKKNVLFYAMGTWAATGTHGPKEDDRWAVVPMPKDPNADKMYTSIDLNAYMWVKGSEKSRSYEMLDGMCKDRKYSADLHRNRKRKVYADQSLLDGRNVHRCFQGRYIRKVYPDLRPWLRNFNNAVRQRCRYESNQGSPDTVYVHLSNEGGRRRCPVHLDSAA